MKVSHHLRAILSLPFAVLGIIPGMMLVLTSGVDSHWDLSMPAYGFIFCIHAMPRSRNMHAVPCACTPRKCV